MSEERREVSLLVMELLSDPCSGGGWPDAESILKDARMPITSKNLLVWRYSLDVWLLVQPVK